MSQGTLKLGLGGEKKKEGMAWYLEQINVQTLRDVIPCANTGNRKELISDTGISFSAT